MSIQRNFRGLLTIMVTLFLSATACSSTSTVQSAVPTGTATSIETVKSYESTPTTNFSPPESPSITPSPALRSTDTPRPPTTTYTQVPTAEPSSTSTWTVMPSSTPTYAILRGTVLEQANCRYGPGAPYLYKYGLYPDNNVEIIGRNEVGTWIVIQAIGGNNPCWVKASLLHINGDVMSVAPMSLPLPQSPYYGPLTGVWGERDGNKVVISWDSLILRAGDDSLQFPYLVEAWLCQDGKLIFTPIGSWETYVIVQDEAGCSEPSHARVYGVEKHGYTAWVTVPWPAP